MDNFEEVGAVGTAVVVTPIWCLQGRVLWVGPRVASRDWFKGKVREPPHLMGNHRKSRVSCRFSGKRIHWEDMSVEWRHSNVKQSKCEDNDHVHCSGEHIFIHWPKVPKTLRLYDSRWTLRFANILTTFTRWFLQMLTDYSVESRNPLRVHSGFLIIGFQLPKIVRDFFHPQCVNDISI